MTSTTDTAEHPDVAEISDLTEGLLSPSRTAEVREHLDTCELCADVHNSLEEIRGLLGTLPGPPRMPAEIAGRIDAALAAEALLGASAPESLAAPTLVGASRDGSDEIDEDGEHAEAHVSRETSPTTTAAARPSGHSRAATGPGRKDRKDHKDRSRGGRRGRIVLGAVFTAAVLGAGSLFIQSLGDHKASDTAQGNATSSTDTFSKGKLENVVSDLLATKAAPNQGTGSTGTMKPWNAESDPGTNTEPSSKAPKTLIEPSTSVPDCIRQGINRGTTEVLGFKEGTYNGSAAYLAVLPDASDSNRVTAYVVDATCVSHHTSAPGKVLLTRSYPRS
ncbi:zf-HC2 domain-containing protein [Streptomyces sp. NBC_00252]|uniref:anti-sigma factor family protein n=1 Tax=Streptomyces sp. NBC_00252 TaxID=2975691 RepID=UPI002E2A1F0E|nr:zf-HC2 domain-containing protein [Streptomyces sp. NBC_00252]